MTMTILILTLAILPSFNLSFANEANESLLEDNKAQVDKIIETKEATLKVRKIVVLAKLQAERSAGQVNDKTLRKQNWEQRISDVSEKIELQTSSDYDGTGYLNLNHEDFKTKDNQTDIYKAERFLNFVRSKSDYQQNRLDYLKTPIEYKEFLDLFNDKEFGSSDMPSIGSKDVEKNCTPEKIRNGGYSKEFNYLKNFEIEKALYKLLAPIYNDSHLYYGSICLDYMYPEIKEKVLEISKENHLQLNVDIKDIPKRTVKLLKHELRSEDFKSDTDKNLFLDFLVVKKPNSITSFKANNNEYIKLLSEFNSLLKEINVSAKEAIIHNNELNQQKDNLNNLRHFINLISLEKSNAVSFAKDEITNHRAIDEDDFIQKLVFACFTINCPEKIFHTFKIKLKSPTFSQYGINTSALGIQIPPIILSDNEEEKYKKNVLNELRKISLNKSRLENIKELSSKNHRIGVLDSHGSYNATKFNDHFVNLFELPSWESKVIEVVHYSSYNIDKNDHRIHSTLNDGFNMKTFFKNDGDPGIKVTGKSNEWLNVGTRKNQKWIHLSQVGEFYSGFKNVEIGKTIRVNASRFFDSFKGKPVSYESIKNKINGPMAQVLDQKWEEDTLWLKVRYGLIEEKTDEEYMIEQEAEQERREANPKEIKPPVKKEKQKLIDNKFLPALWMPLGNEDGSENVNLDYIGC